jgi:hypothetical protein
LNVIRIPGKPHIAREAFDLARCHEADIRYVYTDFSGERHHRIFVLGYSRKALIGQLENPASALATNWDCKAALRITARGKLQLNAGKRKS